MTKIALIDGSFDHFALQDGRHDATEYMRRDALVAGANEAHKRALEAQKRLSRMKRPPKWLLKAVAAIAERTGPLSADLAEYRDIVGKNTQE